MRAVVWPSIAEEVGDWRVYLAGRCLNAGAGDRDMAHLVDGEVVNQDIPGGLHNGRIDLLSPLDRIPVADGHFDSVFCNAVLEHVENPDAVMEEFRRVLKPGGHLYLCVPFLQPHHNDPSDYRRYTREGLVALVTLHGFEALKAEPVHNVYRTLGWIVERWLGSADTLSYRVLRRCLYPLLRNRSRRSKRVIPELASAFRVLARKPPDKSA